MNDFDLCLEVLSRPFQPLRYIRCWISRKPLEIAAWFQRTTNRKWPAGNQMVTWPMTSRDPEWWFEAVRSAILATAWLLVCIGIQGRYSHVRAVTKRKPFSHSLRDTFCNMQTRPMRIQMNDAALSMTQHKTVLNHSSEACRCFSVFYAYKWRAEELLQATASDYSDSG